METRALKRLIQKNTGKIFFSSVAMLGISSLIIAWAEDYYEVKKKQ